jgi:crotonobetainyl-CoA:carnitine CoA-transferase CaiB-like acyl-CoA transferase|tara:strand:- start:1286 stop:2425 length:1140 start_codon:yes stop_codon:yes gene_type:complete
MSQQEGRMTGSLDGITILDVGTLTPGKYCTYLLANLGAEVIRVERPVSTVRPVDDEDLILNQGKRSVTLNLRSDAGKDLYLRLAAGADVVIEGNRPGTADRNGFGYQAVKQHNERIIYCAVSGYGATGPLSQAPAYDLIFLGLSGLLQALGGSDATPPNPEAYLADGVSGLTAAYAVTAALFTRERTRRGTFIDLSMLDNTFSLLAVSHGTRKKPDAVPVTETASPLYDVYPAAEDSYLVLCAIRESSRKALFSHLGRPELTGTSDSDEMHAFLREAFRAKHADVWVAELAPLDIEIGKVNRPDEAFDHLQLRDRGMIGTTSHPDVGEFEFIRPSVKAVSDTESTSTPAPRIGENTEEVLRTIGVDESQLSVLRDEGAI